MGYSSGLPAAPFESIETGDTEAELSGGWDSLAVDHSHTRLAHNRSTTAHGRAVSYAGDSCALDVHASSMPMPVPIPSADNVVRAVGALDYQRSDSSITQSYGYGQPGSHAYGGACHPSLLVSDRDAYSGFS